MQNLILGANKRYQLALTVNAGLGSRYILAASRRNLRDIYLYTLVYKGFTIDSPEITVPKSFLRSKGYLHNILDCNTPSDDIEGINHVYQINNDPVHQDWLNNATGLYEIFPKKHLSIKGTASGIAKYYYRGPDNAPGPDSAYQLAGYEPGWQDHPGIVEHLEKWLDEAKTACNNTRIEVLDLMYWEHRIGGLEAQKQNEWDLIMDQYTPFVTRPWLELMFSVDEKERQGPHSPVFHRMIEMLWPELLKYPINPPDSYKARITPSLKNVIRYQRIYNLYQRVYNRLKQ